MKDSSEKNSAGLLSTLDRGIAPVEDLANMIATIAIFMLMVLGTTQVISRTVFNSPIAGYIDLVELSMAGMAFLGAAYCQRLGAHIRMEILIGNFKGRWIWAFEIIGTLIAMAIIAVLIWYGWGHFLRSYQLGDTTIDAQYPVWPSKLLVPIAFALWFIRLSLQLAGSLRLFIDPCRDPVAVAIIHDVANVAQEEIKETFGEAIDPSSSTTDDVKRNAS